VEQVSEQISFDLDGKRPDLALVFVSSHHAPSYFIAPELFADRLGARALVGCSATGVIGAGREVERRPGVAVTAATLPKADAIAFSLRQDDLPDADAPPEAWRALIPVAASDLRALLLFPDPFTMRPDALLSGLDFAFPDVIKAGALVSGGNGAGTSALFINGKMHRSGVVGLALTGDVKVDTVVAQGCRPVGKPMVVTAARDNMLLGLDGEKPVAALQEMFKSAEPNSRQLIRRSVQLGILNQLPGETGSDGTYVVRNVLGMDPEEGSIAIGEVLREGQIVQFHVRDASTAEEDLRAMLEDYADEAEETPASALMFSSLSLGQRLHGAPDHDTELFQEVISQVPLAGFFSNGEISAVDGHTRLHGYTSSFTLFRQRSRARSRRR
jgi:small ligand-binding sensory domain FIST